MPPPGGMAGMGVSFFGFHRLSRHEQSCNRRRVLQRSADDLRRIDDTLGHQVTVFAFQRVVAVGIGVIVADLADDRNSISRAPSALSQRKYRFESGR